MACQTGLPLDEEGCAWSALADVGEELGTFVRHRNWEGYALLADAVARVESLARGRPEMVKATLRGGFVPASPCLLRAFEQMYHDSAVPAACMVSYAIR